MKDIPADKRNTLVTLASSQMNDTQLLEKRKNEKFAYLIGILAQVFWGINAVHMKSIRLIYADIYTDSSVNFIRFITVTLIGYYVTIRENVKILKHSEIPHLKWFLARNGVAYIFLFCWTKMFTYFRAATVQVINQCNPIVVIFFSICLIGEKFYPRYLLGVFMCVLGSAIIIFNDKKPQKNSTILSNNIFAGIGFGIGNVVFSGLSITAQKVVTKTGMDANLQNFYFGVYTLVPAFFIWLLSGDYFFNIGYILYSLLNGVFFYMANYLTSVAFKYIAASKFQPITYLNIIFSFFFSFILLGEPIFFTDIIGACIIIGYQYYNMQYPPGRKVNLDNVKKEEKEANLIQQNN